MVPHVSRHALRNLSRSQSLVDELVGCGDVPALNELADALTDDSTPATVARGPLKRLGDALARVSDNSDVITIATRTLERLALRNGGAIGAAGFDEADYALRLPLYAVYMGEDDPLRAATVLSAARLEGAAFTDAQRAAGYIKVAQAYLRADDDVNADRFVKRATDPVYRTGDAVMALTLKALTAVVLDAKRRFLEAAVRYLEVVAAGSALVEEVELLKFLQDAATAAILAPAGPQRLRVLGAVLRDSRVTSLDAAVAGMLKHVATGRLIAPDDAGETGRSSIDRVLARKCCRPAAVGVCFRPTCNSHPPYHCVPQSSSPPDSSRTNV